MPSSYDLVVAYRIYPRISKQPFIHPEDKLKLSETCLRSFRDALGDLRVKLYALLDGCPPEYEALFKDLFRAPNLETINLAGEGNFSTFGRQMELLSGQNHADLLYFAEDDYLYTPDSFASMVRFMQEHEDADFLSPYDHLDYYGHPLHRYKTEVRFHGGRHWRSAGSTCMTFMTRKSVLHEARALLETYKRRNYDASIFMSLTKEGAGLRQLATYLKTATEGDSVSLKTWVKAWIFGWQHLLLKRRFRLWTPVPSIATHVQYDALAPGIDWLGIAHAQDARSSR